MHNPIAERATGNALIPFQFEDQTVRALDIEGEPWFVAVDVCAALEISNPTQALSRLDADEVTLISNEGGRPTNAVSESGLYALVLGSRKPQARPFKRWVTHEVIPAIRKTGSYNAPVLTDDQIVHQALQITARRVKELEAKISEDAPKVLFADAVATSDTTILVGDLAKILKGNGCDIGANRLFALLREEGYLIRRRGTDWNMPTQKSMELGLFMVKETAITHADGHVTVNKTPKVTGKGQAYFVDRYMVPQAVA